MFNNPGGKLKTLAHVVFFVEAIGALIGGIILFVDEYIGLGFLTILGGIFSAWVMGLILFGLGEAVDKATEAAENTANLERKSAKPAISNDDQKLLEKLKVKEQQEEEQRKQQQEEEKKERLQQIIQEQGEAAWVMIFLEKAAGYASIREVKNLWEETPKEDNELTEAVSKKIASSFQVERMYGVNTNSVGKLVATIRQMLLDPNEA